jgi:hypothetical protein
MFEGEGGVNGHGMKVSCAEPVGEDPGRTPVRDKLAMERLADATQLHQRLRFGELSQQDTVDRRQSVLQVP